MNWTERLKTYLPALNLPAGTLILHGSTTAGVDDEWSDLDVWLLPPEDQPGKFIEFVCDGKKGHVNIESRHAFEDRMRRCDFALIRELRQAVVLQDDGWAERLIATASKPMPEDVRFAWFAYHYIEMRGEHRACDNPINRGDAIALLLALQPTLTHAMQAAMVLDGEPYPYCKWLPSDAARTPTGAKIVPLVQDMVGLLGLGALQQPGPEGQHPINLKLRQIRQTLIDAARAGGIDAPWLLAWYLHFDKLDGIKHVTWE